MNDPLFEDLLAYKKPLDQVVFNQAVMQKIKTAQKKRKLIMSLFSLIGMLLTVTYLLTVLPAGIWQNLLTPVNGLLLASIGLFIIWLWTVELTSD